MRRPIGVKLVALLYVLLSLNGLVQAGLRLAGGSDDPLALMGLQFLSGAAALATAIGAWRSARWSSLASLTYGVVTAVMLASLPYLLGLDQEAKMGIWSGATIVLLFSVAAGWYLHRQHSGVAR